MNACFHVLGFKVTLSQAFVFQSSFVESGVSSIEAVWLVCVFFPKVGKKQNKKTTTTITTSSITLN